MNIFLWVIQAILAIKLLTTAFSHGLVQSRPEMQVAMQKLGGSSHPLLILTGLAAFLGVLGLILPGLLHWPGDVTPVVAILLTGMLLLSILCHLRSREKPKVFVSLVLAGFAIIIAIGRW
jgi:hypothetical protein